MPRPAFHDAPLSFLLDLGAAGLLHPPQLHYAMCLALLLVGSFVETGLGW